MDSAQFQMVQGSMARMESYLKEVAENTAHQAGSIPSTDDIINETSSASSNEAPDLEKLGKGVKSIVDALQDAGKIDSKGAETVVDFLEDLNERFLSNVEVDKVDAASSVMSVISADISKFASDIANAAPSLILMSPLMTMAGNSIGKFISAIDEKLTDGVEERIGVLSDLSDSVKKFGLNVLIASPGILLGAVALPLLTLSITPLLYVLNRIDDIDKIEDGIGLLPKLGLGLLAFAGGFVASAMILNSASVEPEKFLGLILVLGASSVAMGLIGRYSEDINKGSLAVAGIGLSLLLFTGSLAIANTLIPPFEESGNMLLTLATTGAVYALAGLAWKQILLGSLAFAGVGISMMIMANPLKTLNDAVSNDIDTLWQVPALLGAIGGVYALAGLGPVPLAMGAGALAFTAVGGSLWVLSKGLEKILSLPTITPEKADGIELALRAVVTGFGKSFEDLSVKESLTLPLKIPMVALMGASLIALSVGLKKWDTNAGSWTNQDTELFKDTISGLSEGFALAGSTDGMSTLFGFNVGSNSVERGIESTMKIGSNLKNLSEGIMAWKDMNLTPTDVQQVGENVSRILNVIPNIFAQIGEAERGSQSQASFLGMTFPNPFDKGDVEKGIESVENLGGTLKSLADGVMAWKDGGEAGFRSDQIPRIKQNIQEILAVIPSVFGDIGKADKETEGWFPWSDGDIERGVELVEDLAPSLNSIANLLTSVKGEDITATTDNLLNNLPRLLKGYAMGLNDFANVYNDDIDAEDVIEDMSDLVDVMNRLPKNAKDGTDSVIDGVKELIALNDPLTDVAEVLNKLNESLVNYAETIDDLEADNLKKVASFTEDIAENMSIIAKSSSSMGTSNSPIRVVNSNDQVVDLNSSQARRALANQTSGNQRQATQITMPEMPEMPAGFDQALFKEYNDKLMKVMGELTQMMSAVAAGINENNNQLSELNDKVDGGIKLRESTI